MCRRADAVVCATEEQRADIIPFCSNVHIILDHHDDLVREVKSEYSAGEVFSFVWEGLPHTLRWFAEIAHVLRAIGRERTVALHLITDPEFSEFAGRFRRRRTVDVARSMFEPVHLHQWNDRMLSHVATGFDLGLIPLSLDQPFTRGKPENKLLLLWRMGIPTVVSATPAYARAMNSAALPMACSTPAEWRTTIERYMDDEALRREAGERGRAFAESYHSSAQLLNRWERVCLSL
jgi:hypothetical protein